MAIGEGGGVYASILDSDTIVAPLSLLPPPAAGGADKFVDRGKSSESAVSRHERAEMPILSSFEG